MERKNNVLEEKRKKQATLGYKAHLNRTSWERNENVGSV